MLGAYDADGAAENSGAAYVFRRSGSTWTQEARLFAGDGAYQDFFGLSVGISGDVIVAGAAADDDNGDMSGSAYVFRHQAGSWTQEAKLMTAAADASVNEQFGHAVSVDGDTVVIGAPLDDEGSFANTGSVYVFRYQDGSWVEEARIMANTPVSGDFLGSSVSLSGDTVLVGTYAGTPRAGVAYVFRRNEASGTDASWVEEAMLTASDGGSDFNYFGYAVSLDGNLAMVGAWRSATQAAYLYRRWDDSVWNEVAKLTASDGVSANSFGFAVSVHGDFAVAGAYADDDNGNDAGAVYIYDISNPDNLYPDADSDGDGVADGDEVAEGSDPNDADSTACSPPDSGDWAITRHCTLLTSKTWFGNVTVQNGAVVTIPPGITLDLDFAAHKLSVAHGGGVLIQPGGRVN